MEPTAGTRKRIIRSASAVSSGGGLRATAGQGSSLAPTRAGSDRALSRSDVHDILERLEALSKEEYNASPATSGVSSSRIRELEGKLRVAETEAERQAGKAAFYADEIKELREQDARNRSRIKYLLALLSEPTGYSAATSAKDLDSVFAFEEFEADAAAELNDQLERQRIYYEKQLLQLDRARQADLEELRRREEAHKEEITRLEDRTTKARVLCRQSLREVAEAKKETAEANIHWGTKLAQANGEIASLRKQLEAEHPTSRKPAPSQVDRAMEQELAASRNETTRLMHQNAELRNRLEETKKELSEIRRQRSSDVDAFTGDLAVARHQLKVLERNVRSFLNKAAADKENPGKIFDAKDLGHAKRLANIAAEMDKANNFLSEMKLSALNLRDET